MHGVGIHPDVRHHIRPAGKNGSAKQHRLAHRGVRPCIACDRGFGRHDAPIPFRSGLVAHLHGVALGADRQRFGPAPGHFNRPAGCQRPQGGVDLPGDILLAAKAAPHEHVRNPYLLFLQPQRRRNLVLVFHRPLAAAVDRDRAVCLRNRQAAFEFHIGVFHERSLVLPFYDHIRFTETGLDVTLISRVMPQHVGRLRVDRTEMLLQRRRPGRKRLLCAGDDRQSFQFILHRRRGGFNGFQRLAHHQC